MSKYICSHLFHFQIHFFSQSLAPWCYKAVKTLHASPNYTLTEEHTFHDTRIPDQVTASRDHSFYAMTQREKKHRSLRQRPPNPSFTYVPTKSQRPSQASQLAVSRVHSDCPLSFLAVYPTTRLINSVFDGASTGGRGSTCRMRNHVVMLTYGDHLECVSHGSAGVA